MKNTNFRSSAFIAMAWVCFYGYNVVEISWAKNTLLIMAFVCLFLGAWLS